MITVRFSYYTDGKGYTSTEIVDTIDDQVTAKEYVERLEKAGIIQSSYDAINVALYDSADNLLSQYIWERTPVADTIKTIRAKTGLSQGKFCDMYKIPKRTLESWEEGKRECPVYVIELLKRAVVQDFYIKDYFS